MSENVDLSNVKKKLEEIVCNYAKAYSYYDALQKIIEIGHKYPQSVVFVDEAIMELQATHVKGLEILLGEV